MRASERAGRLGSPPKLYSTGTRKGIFRVDPGGAVEETAPTVTATTADAAPSPRGAKEKGECLSWLTNGVCNDASCVYPHHENRKNLAHGRGGGSRRTGSRPYPYAYPSEYPAFWPHGAPPAKGRGKGKGKGKGGGPAKGGYAYDAYYRGGWGW